MKMLQRILSSLTALTLTLGLSACSETESSSTGVLTSMSEAEGLAKYREDNPYCFLPDGLSLDEANAITSSKQKALEKNSSRILQIRYAELTPDADGYIHDDRMGVKFMVPSGYTAYLFAETGVGEYERCIILTSEYFPVVNNYIMISNGTSVSLSFGNYENAKSWFSTEQAYRDQCTADLKELIKLLCANEDLYCYNYVNVKSNSVGNSEADQNKKELVNSVGNSPDSILGCDFLSGFGYEQAPYSEMTQQTSEFFSDNARIGVKISYHQTRYGVETDKNSYWICDLDGGELGKRIEFSYDSNADLAFDEESFLAEVTSYVPESWDGESYYNQGFAVDDNLLSNEQTDVW